MADVDGEPARTRKILTVPSAPPHSQIDHIATAIVVHSKANDLLAIKWPLYNFDWRIYRASSQAYVRDSYCAFVTPLESGQCKCVTV
jgi:hypothetical protein